MAVGEGLLRRKALATTLHKPRVKSNDNVTERGLTAK